MTKKEEDFIELVIAISVKAIYYWENLNTITGELPDTEFRKFLDKEFSKAVQKWLQ